MFEILWFASIQQLFLLYLVQLITLIYLLKKYKKSIVLIYVIVLFYPAIFAFLGKNFTDLYRIYILLFTLWISYSKKVFSHQKKGDSIITFSFILFCIAFSISSFQSNDTLTIVYSQFSRYIIAYCLWFIVRKDLYKSYDTIQKYSQFTYDIILMQIIITIAKLIIFEGKQIESIVGSLSHSGGAAGTIIPILGFITLWFYKTGKFIKWDWLFIAGLMLIGFLTGKRAVWFIVPIVMASFMIYVPKLKMNKTLWLGLIMTPLAFYLGVRLTPSMNPENKVWGSFDYEYAIDFADKYQFGDKTKTYEKRAQGRGGATLALWEKLTSETSLEEKDLVGLGLKSMYGISDYAEFDKLNLGINHKGSATGVFQTYVTNGFIGIAVTIFFFFCMIWMCKMKRIRWVLLGVVAWEYFMYTGIIFRTPAFMFLLIYFIHYSNYLTRKPKRMNPLPTLYQQESEKLLSTPELLSIK